MRTPYIGITDFTNKAQSLAMLAVLRAATERHIHRRRLHIGVMMSWKTLNGHPTQWATVFPEKEEIADIFVQDPRAYNVLHYADYDGYSLFENLLRARDFGGKNLDAIQLDMIWPSVRDVQMFRNAHPEIEIIIQANTKALDIVGNTQVGLIDKVRTYGNCIEYVLLDKSMGRGVGMDAAALLPFAIALQKAVEWGLFDVSIAAAGGLGPDSVRLVEPLANVLTGISIDAQSKLRASGSALDPIDWGMAQLYLERAATLLDEIQFENR